MSEAAAKDPRTIQINAIRLSFAESLQEKKPTARTEDAKLKHAANIIIESSRPDSEKVKAQIMAAIEAACDKEWKNPKKWQDIAEDNKKRVCFRRGESFKNQETGKVYAGYEGNWAVSASGPAGGQKRPKLFDRHKRTLREQAKVEQIKAGMVFDVDQINEIFYNGTLADVILSFFGTDKGGNGVFCTIESIRSRQEGPRMGGGIEVDADDFEDLDGDDDGFEPAPAAQPKAVSADDLL